MDDLTRWFEEEKKRLDEISSMVNLSDGAVEVLYSIALNFWRNNQLQKAADTYSLVFMARPHNPKYLDAMARCRYDMGDYERAKVLYSYAGTLGESPATYLLRVAQCHLMMGNLEQAYQMIQYVVEGAKVDPSFVPKELLHQAKSMLELLDIERNKELGVKSGGKKSMGKKTSSVPKRLVKKASGKI
ncbi:MULTISPECIES: CDC27 family protein [Candidatus Ichthyocystis]|uniref:CDC27 family protein n=1 Tax=Candidatus Ichthyocystis TaxID=2929841 RepID=UPI000B83B40B|nr:MULTISPECIES: CDC27 family protein [Ichthyocystis]